ncbi:MAG: HAMP domain-containing sensor histidine kinase [Sulfuricurvum sp.]|nr:HAMP domain-containing sensor histidine kinase [Sulfuricurvum sp.]
MLPYLSNNMLLPKRSIKTLFFTLTFITLILIAISSIWLYKYAIQNINDKLAYSAHEKSDTIRYELIRYYDEMIYTFDKTKSMQASKMAVAQRYFQEHGTDAPLEPLQKLLQDSDSQYDIYLVNHDMVVERTTFLHDLHLDFKHYRYVPKLLTSLFENPAMSDLSEPLYESYTDDFKRYHSQAFPNAQHIIQLRQTLKGSNSFRSFIHHLRELIPTLRSQATYTVYINNKREFTSSTEIWSQKVSKNKEKNSIKLWGGLGNFYDVIKRLDPVSLGVFKQPQLFLYPYLNIMFQHDTRKEINYWEHSLYLRMVMLPIKSYYNQIQESYGFLVLELDETQAYHDAQFLKIMLAIGWIILMTFILTMALLFYRRIIAPITSLQFHMHRKTPLQDTAILSKGDEVSRMARTYNWLLNDLKNEAQAKQNLLAQFKTFTANAIHQVRTPLSVIKIAHTMLGDETHKEARLNILSSIVSMEHLYDSLAFTLQNEKIELPVSNLNLSLILEERATLFAPVASSLDTQIMAAVRKDIFVEMNQSELEYLIDNNLSNALKYGQPFKPITLTLTSSPQESILLFQSYGEPISDTNEIFKRYTREDHSKSGSGIGLHIVASICDRYQIIIQVTYEDGKNCFRYFFPAK